MDTERPLSPDVSHPCPDCYRYACCCGEPAGRRTAPALSPPAAEPLVWPAWMTAMAANA